MSDLSAKVEAVDLPVDAEAGNDALSVSSGNTADPSESQAFDHRAEHLGNHRSYWRDIM